MQKKQKKLIDYTVRSSRQETKSEREDTKTVISDKDRESSRISILEQELPSSVDQVLEEIKELISRKQTQGRENLRETQRQEVKENQPARHGLVQQMQAPEFSVIYTDEVLSRLSMEAYNRRDVLVIQCDKSGECRDGVSVGEVFEDSRGIKWQRTFIETTRNPIYLNFIAEETAIKGRVGKAYTIITARGARAIIPEDYICEAINRYGLAMQIDKCTSYKMLPWSDRSKKKENQ